MKYAKNIAALIVLLFVGSAISCSQAAKGKGEPMVLIKTEFGNMKVKLYEKTPEHRNNFLKLVSEGFYNDLLFHRVIEGFMIQGGDPDSRNAAPGERLGGGDVGYTLSAEFVPEYFHKRGALAAARRGGPSNPEKRSSGCQFYIVQGQVFTPEKLDTIEMMINSKIKDELFRKQFMAESGKVKEFRNNNDEVGFNLFMADLRAKADSIFEARGEFHFSPEQRKVYTTIGGYPSLDGDYTVFGEVVEGLEVLDKIAAVETDQYDRPVVDVKMEMELIK